MKKIHFNLQIDCESTEPNFNNPDLGEKAIRGIGDILSREGFKATFAVIPTDIKIHHHIYKQLEAEGHEISLHTHPSAQGYGHFLGSYGYEDQIKIIDEGCKIFEEYMGYRPKHFTQGYASANDHTFPALEALGFTHGLVSIPTRNLPQCACVWGNSPMDAHYPHRYNRCLVGDVDFVDIPHTIDWESRMWGGAHPQDLRIELVDTKNHWYTISKNINRQLQAGDQIPVKYIKAVTHNTFDYSDPKDFRHITLIGVVAALRDICKKQNIDICYSTNQEIAEEYRKVVPLEKQEIELNLDTSGRKY
jgi:peptidoglycan/xylan/chitin deacetylase (PgdA/CDA1 family)